MSRSSVYLLALKSRLVSTFFYFAGLFLFGMMYTGLYDNFSGKISSFESAFPPEFEAFFGDITAAANPAGWLNIELFTLFVPFFVVIIGIGFGSTAIGREEEEGTLELLLASPIKRSKLLTQKMLAIITTICIVVAGAWLSVALGTILFKFDISLVNLFFACLSAILLGVFFGLFSLMVQCISGKRILALGAGSTIFVLTYFAYVIAQISSGLRFLKYFSPYYYFDSANILMGKPKLSNFLLLVGLSVVFYIIAHKKFINRDIGV